jgi:hypothetical protein
MKIIRSLVVKIRKTVTTATLAAGMVVLIQVQTAQADVTDSLYYLTNTPGATLTIGDKTFSNFGYIASGADASELATDAAGLTVTASIVSGVDYLDWSGLIGVDNLFGSSPLLGDLKLTYTVTAASPGSINFIDQSYTPNALPAGGQIIIGETVFSPSLGQVMANSTLTLNPPDFSDPQPEAGDNLTVDPSQTQLLVTKDIFIGAAAGQFVGLSDVEQSFHQVAVPEPATVGCFLVGLGILTLTQRFRQNKRG